MNDIIVCRPRFRHMLGLPYLYAPPGATWQARAWVSGVHGSHQIGGGRPSTSRVRTRSIGMGEVRPVDRPVGAAETDSPPPPPPPNAPPLRTTPTQCFRARFPRHVIITLSKCGRSRLGLESAWRWAAGLLHAEHRPLLEESRWKARVVRIVPQLGGRFHPRTHLHSVHAPSIKSHLGAACRFTSPHFTRPPDGRDDLPSATITSESVRQAGNPS